MGLCASKPKVVESGSDMVCRFQNSIVLRTCCSFDITKHYVALIIFAQLAPQHISRFTGKIYIKPQTRLTASEKGEGQQNAALLSQAHIMQHFASGIRVINMGVKIAAILFKAFSPNALPYAAHDPNDPAYLQFPLANSFNAPVLKATHNIDGHLIFKVGDKEYIFTAIHVSTPISKDKNAMTIFETVKQYIEYTLNEVASSLQRDKNKLDEKQLMLLAQLIISILKNNPPANWSAFKPSEYMSKIPFEEVLKIVTPVSGVMISERPPLPLRPPLDIAEEKARPKSLPTVSPVSPPLPPDSAAKTPIHLTPALALSSIAMSAKDKTMTQIPSP